MKRWMPLALLLGGYSVSLSAEYLTPGISQVEKNAADKDSFNALPVNWKASEEDKAKAQKAWKTISDWLKDGQADTRKLHVVYVTLKDRPAQAGYKERLDRIAKNIQTYYADQMKENGYPPLTFALDMDKEGKVIVHESHLDMEMDKLDVQSSGPPTREAAVRALKKAGIDTDRNYMLIVVQMPDKKGPYYGSGNSENGRCWICDIPHVDTKNLSSGEKGDYRFGTLGNDSTVYIGGTAHELGHCFSLPHTATPLPASVNGSSLMGNGNYTYGQEFRNEGKGTYLIQSDALRLASIALFNGKVKEGNYTSSIVFSGFSAKPMENGFSLKGKVSKGDGAEASQAPVYGLVAYYDPVGGSDYDATATTCIPAEDGTFSMDIVRPGYKGIFEFRLVALLADGKTVTWSTALRSDGKTVPDVASLEQQEALADVCALWMKRDWPGAKAALAKVQEKYKDDPEWKDTLQVWENAVTPLWNGPKGELASRQPGEVKKVDLTRAEVIKASSGWWATFWNSMPPEELGPKPMFKNYIPARFMYTHANGEFVYDLGGVWKELSATAGMPLGRDGNVSIIVLGDGKELFRSKGFTEGDTVPVKVNVEGVKTLTIQVRKNTGERDHGNWGIIADPVITR